MEVSGKELVNDNVFLLCEGLPKISEQCEIYAHTYIHVYTHTCAHTSPHKGMLFSLRKESKPAICESRDKLGRHYAK